MVTADRGTVRLRIAGPDQPRPTLIAPASHSRVGGNAPRGSACRDDLCPAARPLVEGPGRIRCSAMENRGHETPGPFAATRLPSLRCLTTSPGSE